MMLKHAKKHDKPSAEILAQAAAWVARLHGPNRTEDTEAGLRRWLAEAPEHEAAFELLTDTWEKSSRIRRRSFERVASWESMRLTLSIPRAVVAAGVIAGLVVLGAIFVLHSDAVVTGIGEQRTLTLEDGTRVYLNTDSRAVVRYSQSRRQVILEKGEALFEVAKRPNWPFVVRVRDEEVKAWGTTFVVKRSKDDLAVTLVEGKVTVAPVTTGMAASNRSPNQTQHAGEFRVHENVVFTLVPGQRLTLAPHQSPKLDSPRIEHVVAWQHGQVAFDNTPLADAIAEMNRYSSVQLIIEDSGLSAIRISGLFRVGDSSNFAKALVRVYGLQAREDADQITLTRSSSALHTIT